MNNIYQKFIKLISFFTIILVITLSSACAKIVKLQNPTNDLVQVRLAHTDKLRARGLSGTKSENFKDSEAMLFVFKTSKPQQFWMPDTYFNLDIMFLDKDLKIVAIEKNVPHHIGRQEPPLIYRTAPYVSQFVLETRAGVPFSKNLKVGDSLKWVSTTSLSEIIRDTHP